jgi:C4-dicarboxylate-specific signal transduction histidine kinase
LVLLDISEGERELLSSSSSNNPDGLSIEVQDPGLDFALAAPGLVFEAFRATKRAVWGLGFDLPVDY